MNWLALAAESANWAALLWCHRQQLEPLFGRIGGLGPFAEAAFRNPENAVRRAGNTLIFGQPDGGPSVLAFLDQTKPQLDSIESAVSRTGSWDKRRLPEPWRRCKPSR